MGKLPYPNTRLQWQKEENDKWLMREESKYWRKVALANHGMADGDPGFNSGWIEQAKTSQTVDLFGHTYHFKIQAIAKRTGVSTEENRYQKHYSVTVRIDDCKQEYTFQYSHGIGIDNGGWVRAMYIAEAIVRDAYSGIDGFGDFCDNYGYDEDSRKAMRIWESCREVTRFFNQCGIRDSEIISIAEKIDERDQA